MIEHIRDLLSEPSPREARPLLERMDAVLTAGYAQALQLEAERWRIEQRIDEIIDGLSVDTATEHAAELADLAQKRSSADERLSHLRTLLELLKERRSALRDAA